MPYTRRARKGEYNYPIADKFSFVHATVGAMMGLANAPGWVPLLTTLSWEAAEPHMKGSMPKVFPRSTRDTNRNKLGDMLFMMGGWYLTKKKKREPER